MVLGNKITTGGNKFTAGVTDVLNINYEQINDTNHIAGNTAASDDYGVLQVSMQIIYTKMVQPYSQYI